MSVDENKRIVGDFLQALAKGKPAGIFGALDPHISWWIPPSTPLGGHFKGLEAVTQMMMSNAPHFEFRSMGWEVQRMVGEGDLVAVECTGSARTASGEDYNNYFHFQFELKDGKIIGVREYNDSHYSWLKLFAPREG